MEKFELIIKGRINDFPDKNQCILAMRGNIPIEFLLEKEGANGVIYALYRNARVGVVYLTDLTDEQQNYLREHVSEISLIGKSIEGVFQTDIVCDLSTGKELPVSEENEGDLKFGRKYDKKYLEFAKKAGMSEKEATDRLDIMRTFYKFDESQISKICRFWDKPDKEVKKYIPGIEKIIYQDDINRNFLRVVGHVVSDGTNAIRLVGTMSTGKNVFIESLASLLYKPLLDIDMQRNTEAEDFEGRDTLGYQIIKNDKLEVSTAIIDGNVSLSEYEKMDMKLKLEMNNRPQIVQTLEFIKQPLTIAMEHGCWINFNELNFAQSYILARLHRVLDSRQSLYIPSLGEVKAKKGFGFMATMNPPKDGYIGTVLMNEAFETRMMTMFLEPTERIDYLLQRKYPKAYANDIKILNSVYMNVMNAYKSGTLSDSFLAVRRYEAALTQQGFGTLRMSIEDHLGHISCNDEDSFQLMKDIIDSAIV